MYIYIKILQRFIRKINAQEKCENILTRLERRNCLLALGSIFEKDNEWLTHACLRIYARKKPYLCLSVHMFTRKYCAFI